MKLREQVRQVIGLVSVGNLLDTFHAALTDWIEVRDATDLICAEYELTHNEASAVIERCRDSADSSGGDWRDMLDAWRQAGRPAP